MSKTKVADVRREVTTEGRQEIATMAAKLTKYTGRSAREVRPQRGAPAGMRSGSDESARGQPRGDARASGAR